MSFSSSERIHLVNLTRGVAVGHFEWVVRKIELRPKYDIFPKNGQNAKGVFFKAK